MIKTILLADDSLTIQKVVELTFADTEFEVVSLSNGDDLLARLDEVAPDLVICDIIMPGRDGYEVCQEIKSDPATLHIPVILLSGTFEPFDRDRALAAGCSEIITKPFEARKLIDTVEHLLGSEVVKTEAPGETVEAGTLGTTAPEVPTYEDFGAPVAPVTVSDEIPAATETSAPAEFPGTARDDTSLDFTDTGFAEMEAAAARRDDLADQPPEEGLDFDFSDEEDAFGSPEKDAQLSPSDTQPEIDPASDFGDVAEQPAFESSDSSLEPPVIADDEPADQEGAAESPFGADPQESFAIGEPPESETATNDVPEFHFDPEPVSSVDTLAEEVESQEPLHGEPAEEEIVVPVRDEVDAPAGDGWIATPPQTPTPDAVIDENDDPFADPDEIAAPTETPAHDTSPFSTDQPPPVSPHEPEVATGDDIFQESPSYEAEESPAAADTGPVPFAVAGATAEPEAAVPAEVPPPVAAPVGSDTVGAEVSDLSDDDVDRIARRMLELATDRIEAIAWEIVPDMAEIAVRQRVRELEAEAEDLADNPEK